MECSSLVDSSMRFSSYITVYIKLIAKCVRHAFFRHIFANYFGIQKLIHFLVFILIE